VTAIRIESLTDISDCEAIYQYVHNIVDNDDEPAGQPGSRVRMKTGFRTFRPRRAARPRPVFQPCDIARQVPAIDDEMCTAYDRERVDILRYEEKRQNVKGAMHQCGERPLRLFDSHPLALQQVIANGVSN
jgi:hypothetical protein